VRLKICGCPALLHKIKHALFRYFQNIEDCEGGLSEVQVNAVGYLMY